MGDRNVHRSILNVVTNDKFELPFYVEQSYTAIDWLRLKKMETRNLDLDQFKLGVEKMLQLALCIFPEGITVLHAVVGKTLNRTADQ